MYVELQTFLYVCSRDLGLQIDYFRIKLKLG